jgi:hypothetical protein
MPHKVPLKCLGIDIHETNTPWLHPSAYFKNANPRAITLHKEPSIIHSFIFAMKEPLVWNLL